MNKDEKLQMLKGGFATNIEKSYVLDALENAGYCAYNSCNQFMLNYPI